MSTDLRKKKDILERINRIEADLIKAHEFLDTGAHTDWHKFHAIFTRKMVGGEIAPSHKDWVRNVFIPSRQRALKKSERLLERFE